MTPAETPEFEFQLRPVSSSLIAADAWAGDSTLIIKYHNGKIYRFDGLSPTMREHYEHAASKGQYLKRTIEPLVKGVAI